MTIFVFYSSLVLILLPCLINSFEPRVINGHEAEIGQFPYQARLRINNIICSGSLISRSFILGCSHCVGVFAKTINAELGMARWNEPSYVFVPVDEFTQLHHVDMAIYKLKDPITLNDYIQPVQLPTASQAFAPFLDHIGVVSGWSGSPSLQYTQVLFLKSELRHFKTLGYPDESAMTVPGDSGSPLVIFENGITTQVGVHWGKSSNKYMHAAHVGQELAWIYEVTGIPVRKYSFQ